MASPPGGRASSGRERSAPVLPAAVLLGLLGCVPVRAGEAWTWQALDARQGLPAGKVTALETDGHRVFAGTLHGLFRGRPGGGGGGGGGFEAVPLGRLGMAPVLCLEYDPARRDLWVGTFRGLARLNAGRVDVHDQLTSGLANDVVYGLEVEGRYVWAATASGLSRLDPVRGVWTIYNERNTPMKETWCYSVSAAGDLVYVGVWGSGILEHRPAAGTWKTYTDPDKEAELDLFPDDGPVSDVTSSVSFDGHDLWQSTYFGISRYDGRSWTTWYGPPDGPLPSGFVSLVRVEGDRVFACTDRGLAVHDGRAWTTVLAGVTTHCVQVLDDLVLVGTQEGIQVGRRPKATGPTAGEAGTRGVAP